MPNIFKYFSSPPVNPFLFQEAGEPTQELEEDPVEEEPELEEEKASAEEPELAEPTNPVSFAQYQADSILRDARREAEELLAEARAQAEVEAQEVRDRAYKDGFDQGVAEGTVRGMEQAMAECLKNQEEKVAELEEDVKAFLETASRRVDKLLDSYVEELRDLAISIAEKVVCVSLKSSDSVIARMIQNAIDKHKRREWVQIYIAESDVKRLTPIPAQLAASLDALSERVRIIPIADEEPGTCIVEMPEEIVDASASTQIKNIRTMLNKTPLPGAEAGD